MGIYYNIDYVYIILINARKWAVKFGHIFAR